MSYSNPDTMTEVANILEDFNEENLRDIFKSQIEMDDPYSVLPVNRFQPLYAMFKRAQEIEDISEDDFQQIQIRYESICNYILALIMDKYNIRIDNEWLGDNHDKIPAVTMSLYQFFILDPFYNILDILINYISKNITELSGIFSENSTSKDISTLSNLKIMRPEYAIIASSIFDVTDYIFTMLDSETIFSYMNPGYIPANILQMMMNDNIITGDFVSFFADQYKEDLTLRSKISFELIYRIKTHGQLIPERVRSTTETKSDN